MKAYLLHDLWYVYVVKAFITLHWKTQYKYKSSFSSLPLVCMHFIFFIKFSYIGDSCSLKPMSFRLQLKSHYPGVQFNIWKMYCSLMVIYKVPQRRPKRGVWCMFETLFFYKEFIRTSYILSLILKHIWSSLNFYFQSKNFKCILGFDSWAHHPNPISTNTRLD